MTKEKITSFICGLYIALGPISWMSGMAVGPIKRVLLFLCLLLNIRFIISHKKSVVSLIVVMISLYITMKANAQIFDDYTNLFWGIIENFIVFLVGYNFAFSKFQDKGFLYVLLMPVSIACLMTISNFLTGIPNWYAPSQYSIAESIQANQNFVMKSLYETGFSWGRNGWGNSLALYLPLCFILRNYTKKIWYYIYIVILISILLSGTRNGLLSSLITLFFYLKYKNVFASSKMIPALFAAGLVGLIVVSNSDFLVQILRLDVEDVSAGRIEQYQMIPILLTKMGFWGIGQGESANLMLLLIGEYHQLHNTYFNILVEFGYILFFVVLGITIRAIKIVIKSFKLRDERFFILSLVLLSGLSSAMFEPRMVFGNLGGCCMWWFAFGLLCRNLNESSVYE